MSAESQRQSLSAGSAPAAPLLQRGLALAMFGVLGYAALDYPAGNPLLAIGVIAFAALNLRDPDFWLFGFPVLLPSLNLASWSGRFFFEEFDLFLLAIVATGLWRGQYLWPAKAALTGAGMLWITLFFVSSILACLHGLWPLPEADLNAWSSYESPYNALRVGRGLLWPVLLLPLLRTAWARDAERAAVRLMGGILLGLIGTGLVIVWERGVLVDLVQGVAWYGKLRGLLDHSANYRATALFSEMHTGGEAIDGYLALTIPFAVLGLFLRRPGWLAPIAFLAMPLGLYSAFATFSRASYLAVAVIALGLSLGGLRNLFGRGEGGRLLRVLLPILWLPLAGGFGFQRGGFALLTLLLFEWSAAFLLGYRLRSITRGAVVGAILLGWLGLTMLLIRYQMNSKWAPVGFFPALLIAVALSLPTAAAGLAAGRALDALLPPRAAFATVAVVTLLLGAGTAFGSGSLMQGRFTQIDRDSQTRWAHWRQALALMAPGWDSALFGMGLGSFPRLYLFDQGQDAGGRYAFRSEAGNEFLELSGGQDLRLGQRLELEAGQDYRLSLRYRTAAESAQLYVRLCRRNVVQMMEWNPECKTLSRYVESTRGAWQALEWHFNIGEVGSDWRRPGRHPLTLELMNRREYGLMARPPAIVDFDDIEILDSEGNDRVSNGDFSRGMDHWFPYCDFNHLPWHIKNLWVDLYFEQGLLGVVAFAGLLGAFFLAVLRAPPGQAFALGAGTSVLAFLTVGLVGTLFDVPRLMVLFSLIVFAQLLQTAPESRPKARREFVRAAAVGRNPR